MNKFTDNERLVLFLAAVSLALCLAAVYCFFAVIPGAPLVFGRLTNVNGTLESKARTGDYGAGPAFFSAGANEWRVSYRYVVGEKSYIGNQIVPAAQSLEVTSAPWLSSIESGSSISICVSESFPSFSALKCGKDANDEFWKMTMMACLFSFFSIATGRRLFLVLKGNL